VSTGPVTEDRPADTIAGLLAALSVLASAIGLAYRPARLIPFALLLAVVAVAMGGRNSRLAAAALVIGGVCFVVGMSVAVITNNPVF
jgi:hypothetical protein